MGKTRCSYYSDYQAIRKPTCGCDCCWDKWALSPKANGREKVRRKPANRPPAGRPKTNRPRVKRPLRRDLIKEAGLNE